MNNSIGHTSNDPIKNDYKTPGLTKGFNDPGNILFLKLFLEDIILKYPQENTLIHTQEGKSLDQNNQSKPIIQKY